MLSAMPSQPAPPRADPTAAPSSTGSPEATGSSRLGGVLAGRTDLETWVPETAEVAQSVVRDVAAYCRDYCPARLACVEDACRLYRLESRSAEVLSPGPTDDVGVLGIPMVGL